MSRYRQPLKLIRDYFRDADAVVERKVKKGDRAFPHPGTQWRFPNGSNCFVADNIGWAHSFQLISVYCGIQRVEMERRMPPSIIFEELLWERHARERLALMLDQSSFEKRWLRQAIEEPDDVRWSWRNDTWMFTFADITLAIRHLPSGVGEMAWAVVTVLWSTNELWARFPRPELTSN